MADHPCGHVYDEQRHKKYGAVGRILFLSTKGMSFNAPDKCSWHFQSKWDQTPKFFRKHNLYKIKELGWSNFWEAGGYNNLWIMLNWPYKFTSLTNLLQHTFILTSKWYVCILVCKTSGQYDFIWVLIGHSFFTG